MKTLFLILVGFLSGLLFSPAPACDQCGSCEFSYMEQSVSTSDQLIDLDIPVSSIYQFVLEYRTYPIITLDIAPDKTIDDEKQCRIDLQPDLYLHQLQNYAYLSQPNYLALDIENHSYKSYWPYSKQFAIPPNLI